MFNIKLYDPFSYLMAHGLIFFIVTYFISLFINIYVINYNKKSLKNLLSGIIFFGFFMVSWIPINILCLFKKNVTWEQIIHNRNIELSEIIK